MNINHIIEKALNSEDITLKEALHLYEKTPLTLLMKIANNVRHIKHPNKIVTWIIDRNINITNVCISGCKFCNFHCSRNSKKAFITTIEEYTKKINELYQLGGRQILLQGGLHPDLDLKYYCNLFSTLKKLFPDLKLHALGPPEIVYLAKKENCSYESVLKELITSGLDSLPGAGAEILSDRVRKILSPLKCTSNEWLEVMAIAHKLNLITTATMVFGHIETIEERIEHLFKIRNLQNSKPQKSIGFISFIPWPMIFKENSKFKNISKTFPDDYIRLIAISRIILHNIKNIQASWLTIGKRTAQVCLHSGANDLGSIMIEENVLSSTGFSIKITPEEMQKLITEAGFIPRQRNQAFELI